MTPVPTDIRSGEPLFPEAEWRRLSEHERMLCAYHNSPHRQLMGEMYRAIRRRDEQPTPDIPGSGTDGVAAVEP